MNVALWIVAGNLAVALFVAGMMKAARPHERLAANMNWAEDFTPSTVKLIGALAMLGAIGLLLPPLLGVTPILAPIAASGLAVMMIAAVMPHTRRGGEGRYIMANVVLMASAAFVAIGRSFIGPF